MTICLRQLDAAEWVAVGSAIAVHVRLCAALLARDMPGDIERAFAAAGTSLFPVSEGHDDDVLLPGLVELVQSRCVRFFLMGEEFDRDPFLLFVLRGREREDVRDLLRPQAVDEGARVAERPSVAEPPCVKRARKSLIRTAPAVVSSAAFWGDAAGA